MTTFPLLLIVAILSIVIIRQFRHNRALAAQLSVLEYRTRAAEEIYARLCERHAYEIAWAETVTSQQAQEAERAMNGPARIIYGN